MGGGGRGAGGRGLNPVLDVLNPCLDSVVFHISYSVCMKDF